MKIFSFFFIIFFCFTVRAQSLQREFSLAENGSIEITNLYGRVRVIADESEKSDGKIIDAEEKVEAEKAVLTVENAREAD